MDYPHSHPEREPPSGSARFERERESLGGRGKEVFLLAGRDVIGLAETGSGKTAAFALPILQALLDTPTRLFALVLTPTRSASVCVWVWVLGSPVSVWV